MQKPFKIIIVAFVAVWIFGMGFEIGTFRETKKHAVENPPTQSAVAQPSQSQPADTTAPTTQPSTTAPSSEAPQVTDTTAPSDTQPSSSDTSGSSQPPSDTQPSSDTSEPAAPLTNAQLLEKVTTAINNTKTYAGSFTASQNKVKQLRIVDCSVPSLTSTVDGIVQKAIGGEENETYSFNGGTGTDSKGNTITPTGAIPPENQNFGLTEAGLASITGEPAADGSSTVYKLTLVPETSTMEQPPLHNAASIGSLDLSDISIIKSFDATYSGSSMEVTVNANGLVTNLVLIMPINAKGVGKVGFAEGNATFEGSLNETWTFTYA